MANKKQQRFVEIEILKGAKTAPFFFCQNSGVFSLMILLRLGSKWLA